MVDRELYRQAALESLLVRIKVYSKSGTDEDFKRLAELLLEDIENNKVENISFKEDKPLVYMLHMYMKEKNIAIDIRLEVDEYLGDIEKIVCDEELERITKEMSEHSFIQYLEKEFDATQAVGEGFKDRRDLVDFMVHLGGVLTANFYFFTGDYYECKSRFDDIQGINDLLMFQITYEVKRG